MRRVGLFLLLATAAPAQTRLEVRGTAGGAWFLDESPIGHYAVGGSARFYLTERLSLEPEVLYLRKDRNDQDFVLLPNAAFDFVRRGRDVVPYVIGGAGLIRTRLRVGTGFFSSNSWSVSGGVGVKVFVSPRWFIAPEGRIGTEPLTRLTVSIGYVITP